MTKNPTRDSTGTQTKTRQKPQKKVASEVLGFDPYRSLDRPDPKTVLRQARKSPLRQRKLFAELKREIAAVKRGSK